ncbi:MAG: RluA family pseudouridine synthase [Caldimicrobium sp.]
MEKGECLASSVEHLYHTLSSNNEAQLIAPIVKNSAISMEIKDQYIFEVEENNKGLRLDQYLKGKLPQYSRAFLQKLIKEGLVEVDDKKAKSSQKIKTMQRIKVIIPQEKPLELQPKEVPFEIIYEDEDLAVIFKPAGIVVHPAPGHYDDTLVHGLLLKLKNLSGIGGKLRPGIVHRLDKDTSGLMLVAKNDFTHKSLVHAFKHREIKKYYLALLYEKISPPRGIIEKPIGRHPKLRKKMAIIQKGKLAITEYEVLRYFKKVSYIIAKPLTGRTHQLRLHFASLGHPILGDPLYGGIKPNLPKPKRLMLHAWKLSFLHPRLKKELHFEKEPPEDFINYLNQLEESSA